MSDEIKIRTQVTIRKGNVDYRSNPTQTVEDQTGEGGPAPGAFLVTTTGQNVDLSQFTTPGRVWIQNQDDTNYIEVGVHDGTLFHPFLEILQGNIETVRFSRNIGEEQTIPGTGTTGNVNTIYVKAHGASCWVTFDAFEA